MILLEESKNTEDDKMKFFNIELTNYRSYKDLQKIDFSINPKKNVTIILGVNGAGKTNILNAINWCLYGDEPHLSKYSEKKPIINQSIEHELKEGETTECKVKIMLGGSKPEFSILRTIFFKKIKGKIEEIDKDFEVKQITDRGWITSPDSTFVVNNVLLPKKIREFFLFDGERLDEFFKSGNEDLIRDAVLDVAQIGLLERALKHLNDVSWSLKKEISIISPKTKEILEKISIYKKSIEDQEKILIEKGTEKKKALNELDEIKRILRDHPIALIRELQRSRDELDNEIESINEKIAEIKVKNAERIIVNAPFIFGEEAISKVLDLINKEFDEGRLPPPIEDIFVKNLLKKGKCICGIDLSKHTECRITLERVLKTIPQNAKQVTSEAYDIRYTLESLKNRNKMFFYESVKYDKQLKGYESELETKNKKRREIGEKIGKHSIQEIENLESNREQLEQALEIINFEIKDLNRNIERIKDLKKIEESDFNKETKKETKVMESNLRVSFCDEALNTLEKIREELIEKIREIIEKRTKEYFLNLIWKKKAYTDVKLSNDYRISVIDRYGVSCLGSLSAGERQVLALSFMAALYEVSGFDMPAVIDTPLGRISGEPRENIAKSLPIYLSDSQLTLLILDTEYTKVVQNIISGRVGKEYVLEFDDEKNETKVKLHDNK